MFTVKKLKIFRNKNINIPVKLKKIIFLLLIVSSIIFLKFVISAAINDEDKNDNEALVNVRTPDGSLITCGVERWSIKTLIDPDTINVDFANVLQSTIQYQRSLTKPLTLPDTRLPQEDSVYSLDCIMYKYKLEDDNDIHIVIHEIGDTSQTMVAEILNAQCPGIISTSRYTQFNNLRKWFDSTYHPTSTFTTTNVRIRISGVGYFDFLHGQTGIPPNGREIHPVLSFLLITNINKLSKDVPAEYKLFQNFPNPFNPSTTIKFDISEKAFVILKIYDLLGKEISNPINEPLQAGSYSVDWNGAQYPSGIYFYRLESGKFSSIRKMLLIK